MPHTVDSLAERLAVDVVAGFSPLEYGVCERAEAAADISDFARFPLSAIHRRCDPNRPRARAAPALSATSLLIASDRSIGAMPQLVQG
jgi:hypothetical protein